MIVLYDYRLIVLSIAIAMLASHGGILLFTNRKRSPIPYKTRLVAGGIIIGSGIWTMHFIGMLALNAPLPINYAILPTLVSALIAIVLTGLSLYCATSGVLPKFGLPLGAILMGGGIASMHYIGMEALKSVCSISYSKNGVALSIVIGIAASWLSLKCLQYEFKTRIKSLAVAGSLGLAISTMHYFAMFNTQFEFINEAVILKSPVLDKTFLACLVAVATFLIVNSFLLIALPPRPKDLESFISENAASVQDEEEMSGNALKRIRIDSNGEIRFINIENIIYVSADGHYTQVGFIDSDNNILQKICNHSLSTISDLLSKFSILQCHRSHLVNMQHVQAIQRKGGRSVVTFKHPDCPNIPISRSKLSTLLSSLDNDNSLL